MSQHIASSYRAYLRQVRALPHVYLRIKGAADFRSVLKTKSVELGRKKLNRVSKDLKRLQAANGGNPAAFDRILDIAYGRVGKLRWELMEPLLSDLGTPLRTSLQKACLPTYSPELAALLTSGISRPARALQRHHLVSPPGLPGRAKSGSEDAMLLGPLSRRREHNIRWRFFKSEQKKVYPPLWMSPRLFPHRCNTHTFLGSPSNLGPQNIVVLQELLTLAGSPSMLPEPTRKQKKSQKFQKMPDINPFDGNLPTRWLRRRYQTLLGKIPLPISRPLLQDDSNRTYDIQLAGSAITAPRTHLPRLRAVGAEDVSWISSDVYPIVQSGRRHR